MCWVRVLRHTRSECQRLQGSVKHYFMITLCGAASGQYQCTLGEQLQGVQCYGTCTKLLVDNSIAGVDCRRLSVCASVHVVPRHCAVCTECLQCLTEAYHRCYACLGLFIVEHSRVHACVYSLLCSSVSNQQPKRSWRRCCHVRRIMTLEGGSAHHCHGSVLSIAACVIWQHTASDVKVPYVSLRSNT